MGRIRRMNLGCGLNKVRIFLLVVAVFCVSGVLSQSVFAELNYDENGVDMTVFSQNETTFYQHCYKKGERGVCGTNENYAGEEVFKAEQLEMLEKNQPFYEKAASQYGFPWEILAVIHYRETGLARGNPENGEGIYQLTSYTNEGKNENAFRPAGAVSDEEFQRQTDITAKLINDNYGAGLNLNTDDGIKTMFFKYNGVAQVYIDRAIKMGFSGSEANMGEGSPYVMNRYDAQRDPDSSEVSEYWKGKYTGNGKYDANAKDMQWGSFTVYKALTCGDGGSGTSGNSGANMPSCNSCKKGSKNINGAAVCLAWPYGTEEEKYAYLKGGEPKPISGYDLHTIYKDAYWKDRACSRFVGGVVRWSYDKNFKDGIDPKDLNDKKGNGNQLGYAYRSDLWEVIEWDDNFKTSDLRGGDIINDFSGSICHSLLIVEDEEGEKWIANAHSGADDFGFIEEKAKDHHYLGGKRFVIRATKANNSNAGVSVTKGVKTSSSTGKINNTGKGNLDIGATARYFAWPEGTEWKDWNKHAYRAEEWEKLREENGKEKIDIDGELTPDEHMSMGRSCVLFVWGVLKYAGLSKNFGSTERLDDDELKKGGDWEKVGTGLKVSELEDGDVLVYYHSGSSEPYHYAIFIRDENNKGHIVEASLSESNLKKASYGLVKEKLSESKVINATVYRNKKNKSGGSCAVDLECKGGDDDNSGGGTLKSGGYKTMKEADKAIMEPYREMGNFDIAKYGINPVSDRGCNGLLIDNCVTFSRYFFNRYTTKEWSNEATGNGRDVANNIAKKFNLPTGNKPRPYAIFSTLKNSATLCGNQPCGHTGVILGVDAERKKVIIGQAGWCQGKGFMHAIEGDVDEYSSGYTYVYLDSILVSGGLADE